MNSSRGPTTSSVVRTSAAVKVVGDKIYPRVTCMDGDGVSVRPTAYLNDNFNIRYMLIK